MNLQSQLSEIIQSIQYLKVESTLIGGAILLLILGLIKKSNGWIKSIYALTISIAFYFNIGQEAAIGEILSRSIFVSQMSIDITFILLISGILILVFQRPDKHATEFYFFILSILAGSIFMMKSNSILLTFIAVELTSFTAYILTNFSFKKKGHEAGIKYLLFGAVSSAVMLFGFGLLYGSSGIFFISDFALIPPGELTQNIGLLLIICGILFKSSILPFHIWVPATYQEAPCDATAILSIIPKLAALILLGRVLISVEQSHWIMDLCLLLGMATIIFGVFAAIRQSNVRRMISFGAIAHSGFLLPLVTITSATSDQVFWWYAGVYAVMNLAVFFLLDEFEKRGLTNLQEYSGLGSKFPIVSITLTLILISLIGLPPLAGFTAKLLLFTTIWEEYALGQSEVYLSYLIVAVFATLISLFFYLKIPYQLFLVKAKTSRSIEFSFSTKFVATFFSIVLLLLFFAPQILTVMQQLLSKPTP